MFPPKAPPGGCAAAKTVGLNATAGRRYLSSADNRASRFITDRGRPDMDTCPICGAEVERQADTGRPPIYCRPAHRQAAYKRRLAEAAAQAA